MSPKLRHSNSVSKEETDIFSGTYQDRLWEVKKKKAGK